MRLRRKPLLIVFVMVCLATVISPVFATGVVNMEFKQAPLVDVFQILGQLGGYNVLVDPSVSGDVSFVLNDLPVHEALDLVTRTTGYRYKLMGNTLVVASEQRLKTEFGTEDVRFVSVNHVDVADAQRLVTLMVPGIRSYVDPDLKLVVLFGVTSDLERADKVVAQYDRQGGLRQVQASPQSVPVIVETKGGQESLVSGSITLLYGDGPQILEAVRSEFTHREFTWNGQTRMLTGLATAEEWEQVGLVVRKFDVPNFVVKGILSSAEQMIALVEYQGSTTMLKVGETLHGWTVQAILAGSVEFAQESRSFAVGLGR